MLEGWFQDVLKLHVCIFDIIGYSQNFSTVSIVKFQMWIAFIIKYYRGQNIIYSLNRYLEDSKTEID